MKLDPCISRITSPVKLAIPDPLPSSSDVKPNPCVGESEARSTCTPRLEKAIPRRSVTLTPYTHDSLELANLAIFSIPNKLQDLKFSHHHAINQWQEFCFSSTNPRLNLEALTAAINIFSALFFLNTLPSKTVQLQWFHFSRVGKPSTQGQTIFSPQSQVTVLLNPNHPRHRRNDRHLLCTVLHEMCHAFLGRFGYRDLACRVYRREYGKTGHGHAWQLLTKAIEASAPLLLAGFAPRLGRTESAVLEIEKGGWRPSEADVQTLFEGLDEVKVRVWLSWCWRDDDAVMAERLQRWAGRGQYASRRPRRRWTISCLRRRDI